MAEQEKEIGKVTHWYDKISVAVVKLSGALATGDRIKVRRGKDEFETEISSMQIDHQQSNTAKKGDEVAVKLPQKTKEGAIIYKIS